MIYQTKIQFTKQDQNGNDKIIRETYLVNDASCFGDAEEQTYEYCQGQTNNDIDVIDVKRSRIKEIINARRNFEEKIFIADVADVQTNDEGEEIEMVYKMALFAINLDDAYSKLKEHLLQGYSMVAIGVKKTKIFDVIL